MPGIDAALRLFTMFAPLLFGRKGGEEVSGELPPEISALLFNQLATANRSEALVDPANFANLGFNAPPPDAVPLRAAANRLAFALLPNFVRPSNSAFPGTDDPMLFLNPGGGAGSGGSFFPTPGDGSPAVGSSIVLPGSSGGLTGPKRPEDDNPQTPIDERFAQPGVKVGPGVGVDWLRDKIPGITDEEILKWLNEQVP